MPKKNKKPSNPIENKVTEPLNTVINKADEANLTPDEASTDTTGHGSEAAPLPPHAAESGEASGDTAPQAGADASPAGSEAAPVLPPVDKAAEASAATEPQADADTIAPAPLPVEEGAETSAAAELNAAPETALPVYSYNSNPDFDGGKTKPGLSRKRIAIIAAVLLALILAGVAIVNKIYETTSVYAPSEFHLPLNVEMQSDNFNRTGVIYLTGLEKINVNDVKTAITLTPKTDFTVEKQRDGKMKITLENELNRYYTLAIKFTSVNQRFTFYPNGEPLEIGFSLGARGSIYLDESVKLIFSEDINYESLKANLTVEPATFVNISVMGDTALVSAQNGSWNSRTRYTITIGEDYQNNDGIILGEEANLVFAPQERPTEPSKPATEVKWNIEITDGESYVLTEEQNIQVYVKAQELKKPLPIMVEVYKLSSLQKFKEQSAIIIGYDVPLDAFEKVDTNAFVVENGETRFDLEKLPAGAYIVCTSYKDPETDETVVCKNGYIITALSVYVQSNEKDTLVWVNSSQNASASGLTVKLEGIDSLEGKTDSQGLALIQNKRAIATNVAEIMVFDSANTLIYYDNAAMLKYNPLNPFEYDYDERYYDYYRDESSGDKFYHYFFLDRLIYKPTDTISFWGYIKPFRNNKNELPPTINIVLDPGGFAITQTVAISPEGTYSGEINLEALRSSNYQLSVNLEMPGATPDQPKIIRNLTSEYITVKQFQKPSYVITSTTDKAIYKPEDTVTVTAKVTFYDGTPLGNFELDYYVFSRSNYDWRNAIPIKTDEEGNVTFSFRATEGNEYLGSNTGIRTNRYKISIESDGESINNISEYMFFPSDTIVSANYYKQPDGNLSLRTTARKIDYNSPALAEYLDKLAAENTSYYYISQEKLLELAGAEPVELDVDMRLSWSGYYNKDFKTYFYTRYKDYDYVDYDTITDASRAKTQDEIRIINEWDAYGKRFSVKLTNGSKTITDVVALRNSGRSDYPADLYAYAALSYRDGRGNDCYIYSYFPDYNHWNMYGDGYSESSSIIKGYSFNITSLDDGADLTPTASYYRSVNMDVDEKAEFTLLHDSKATKNNGKIFYSIIQDGTFEYAISTADSFTLDYDLLYGKSVNLVAAYFDGTSLHFIKQLSLVANTVSLGVKFDVKADKETYRPGETVRLEIKTTDHKGNPVAGNLCVSVVDESIFALRNQTLDVVYELYSEVNRINNSVKLYSTSARGVQIPKSGWEGGKGEEGMEFYDSNRSNFKDTALFLPTRTDSSGNAVISFVMPDNITSWRVTTVAITDDNRGGHTTTNLITTLPFFVKPVINQKYIEGDDIGLLVQGFGTVLKGDSEMDYTITINGDQYEKTLTAKGVAYQSIPFNFGKLPIGSYTVSAKAQHSGYSDTVTLPFSVIKSNLELIITTPVEVAEKIEVNAARYPVILTFHDEKNEPYFATINSLFGHYCMQANQRLSRFVAKRVISRSLGDTSMLPSYIRNGNDFTSDMQNQDGGLAPYPGSESELLTSMYVLQVAKDQFDLKMMSGYFRAQLDKTSGERELAACYLGLAVTGECTKEELITQMEKSRSTIAKAYCIAGLAYLGETETATKLYNELLAPVLKQKPALRYDYWSNNAWNNDAAAIWIASSLLNEDDADMLSLYLGGTNWRYSTLFEAMIYVTNYTRPVQSSFSYTLNGETKDYFTANAFSSLILSKSELENIRFSNFGDSLNCTAYYVGEPIENGIAPTGNVSIKKETRDLGENLCEVTLTVDFTSAAPTGYYDISDWVPTNSRLMGKVTKVQTGSYNDWMYYKTEDQNIYISLYHHSEKSTKITYTIKKLYDTEAMLDTVYIIHGESGENANTEKEVFSFK